jgi:hypothetical protein
LASAVAVPLGYLFFDIPRARVSVLSWLTSPQGLWDWDGANWTRRVTTVFPKWPNGSFVHDRGRQRVLWLQQPAAQGMTMWEWTGTACRLGVGWCGLARSACGGDIAARPAWLWLRP